MAFRLLLTPVGCSPPRGGEGMSPSGIPLAGVARSEYGGEYFPRPLARRHP